MVLFLLTSIGILLPTTQIRSTRRHFSRAPGDSSFTNHSDSKIGQLNVGVYTRDIGKSGNQGQCVRAKEARMTSISGTCKSHNGLQKRANLLTQIGVLRLPGEPTYLHLGISNSRQFYTLIQWRLRLPSQYAFQSPCAHGSP